MPSHRSRGIYRTRDETTRIKETVLDAWRDGATTQACADAVGIELGYANGIIKRARQQGDPRAARRRAPNNFDWSDGITQQSAVLTMHDAGMSIRSISRTVGATTKRVGETLSRAGLVACWEWRGLSVAGPGRPLRGTVPSGTESPPPVLSCA